MYTIEKDEEMLQLFLLKDEDPREVSLVFAKFLSMVKEMKVCYDVFWRRVERGIQ